MPGEKPHNLTLIAPLPPSLADLLSRELAFTLAREKLVHALEETRTHQKITQETRPPFLLLQRTKVRKEIQSALVVANETIELLERGLAKLDRYAHQLHGLIAHRIENRIRNVSDDYVRSLVAYFHREDWHRLELRLEHYTTEFQSALVTLAKTCEELPRNSEVTLQSHYENLVLNAVRAAHQFEAEITFINRISDTQNQQSELGGATLERQIALDWTAALHEISHDRVGVAISSLMHLATKLEEVGLQALQALKNEGDPTHFSNNNEPQCFHTRQWELMRKSVQYRVKAADIAALAEETERLLESGYIAQLALKEDDHAKVTHTPPPVEAPPRPTMHTAPKPVIAPPTSDAPVLRLRTRQPKDPSAPHLTSDSPPAYPPTGLIKPSAHELSAMRKDVEQQRALLLEEKAKLQARATYLEESQALLRANLQEHQQREALLAQRAKALDELEEQNHSPTPV